MLQRNPSEFMRVQAIHPHWRGSLLLSQDDDVVFHEADGSRGRYRLLGDELIVRWDQYPPDRFRRLSGVWVHDAVVAESAPIDKLRLLRARDRHYFVSRVRMFVPEAAGEVELRLHTSDIPTFGQIFLDAEYASPNLPAAASAIVDLGANIGLATLYFAARYPDARILAVEPEAENFDMLLRNTATLSARVQRQHAAVWLHDGQIGLRVEDEARRSLGAWGVQVTAEPRPDEALTPCYRLATLLDIAGFPKVDILKVDIEGAELELFSEGVQDCLARIGMVIIETHDRFRPGSEAAVRKALAPLFIELPRRGENLFFRHQE